MKNYPETWCDIEGFEHRYRVSNYGRIYSLLTNKVLKLKKDDDGYNLIVIRDYKTKKHTLRVSVLVAKSYVGNPAKLKIVNHIDTDITNDYFENLEWTNVRENTCHGIKQNKKLPIGVSQRKGYNKFRARIIIDGKNVSLGDFDTPELASEAYCKKLSENQIRNKYAK